MKTSNLNGHFKESVKQVDKIIDSVIERGYDDVTEEIDDYRILLQSFEFKKLVTFSIYDEYFPPRRHEFELQLLTKIIDFLASAVASGVVYDVIKNTLYHVIRQLKTIKRSRNAFQEISDNLDRIHKYFLKHDNVSIDEICSEIGIESNKIEPLMKLLGFRRRRKKNRQIWSKPDWF